MKNKYHNRSSLTDMLSDLQWKSLQDRRKEARLTMLYKIMNSQVAIPTDHRLKLNTAKSEQTTTSSIFTSPTAGPSTDNSPTSHAPFETADLMSARSVDAFRSQLAKHFI